MLRDESRFHDPVVCWNANHVIDVTELLPIAELVGANNQTFVLDSFDFEVYSCSDFDNLD